MVEVSLIGKLVGAFNCTIELDIVGSKRKLVGVFEALIPYNNIEFVLKNCILIAEVITIYRRDYKNLRDKIAYSYNSKIEKMSCTTDYNSYLSCYRFESELVDIIDLVSTRPRKMEVPLETPILERK